MNLYKSLLISAGLLLGVFLLSPSVFAQSSLSRTITPPLFKVNLGPGETWKTTLKVVNVNPYDITVYANVVNFESEGEGGRGRFIAIQEGKGKDEALARWINISREPIVIGKEKTVELSFSLDVPADASPGGHYAAILVGTQPIEKKAEGPELRVSSMVSSLIFVSVRGDIKESGFIREFITEKKWYEKPDVNFFLRFENAGNVHLQPKGEITIYNMWGKERGKMTVNENSEFGNVLPRSIRKFEFIWKGEENFFELGRYRALARLTYGKEAEESATRETSFWIIPIKPLGIIAGSLLLFFILFIWLLRAYVKRMLALEVERHGLTDVIKEKGKWTLPLREGMIDLRKTKEKTSSIGFSMYVKKYYKAILFLVLCLLVIFFVGAYLKEVLTKERTFEIIIPQKTVE